MKPGEGQPSPSNQTEMMFQVGNTPEGYVVSCYHDGNWHPLRNFGERQGDAFAFRDWDCPHLDDAHIRMLERAYSKDKRYIRHSSTKFAIEREI